MGLRCSGVIIRVLRKAIGVIVAGLVASAWAVLPPALSFSGSSSGTINEPGTELALASG